MCSPMLTSPFDLSIFNLEFEKFEFRIHKSERLKTKTIHEIIYEKKKAKKKQLWWRYSQLKTCILLIINKYNNQSSCLLEYTYMYIVQWCCTQFAKASNGFACINLVKFAIVESSIQVVQCTYDNLQQSL